MEPSDTGMYKYIYKYSEGRLILTNDEIRS